MNSRSNNQAQLKRLRSLYLGIFLTALSSILFEISLTKIFSVTLWYHFAYLAVSLALFGLGAGGLAAFLWRSFFSTRFPSILKHLAALQFLSMIGCLVFVLGFRSGALAPRLALTYLVCSVPFFVVGLIVSLALRHYSKNTPKIYFADLFGAGAGCLVFVIAISVFSGPAVVILGAVLALVASLFFTESDNKFGLNLRIVTTVLVVLLLAIANARTEVFAIKFNKKYKERKDLLFEKWSPLARITVYPKLFWKENPKNPFGWGMSRTFKPEKPIRQLWVEQDGSAGTPITRFTGDISEVDFLQYDVTSFAYHVWSQIKDVFIIGVGGGRDVLTALSFGANKITGCDINPVTVGLVKERFSDFAGKIYALPQVNVVVADGRNFIRNQKQNFDFIQISLIDSWAATVAGAFSLAENNLYTVEAFSDYLDRLNDNGVLSITRFLFSPRNQSLRVAILARKALEGKGVEHPERHVAVISTSTGDGMATILVKKTALTKSDIASIQEAAQKLDFEVLQLPGIKNDADFSAALTTRPLQAYLASSYYDLSPSTDDKPFFFQMLYFSRAFDLIRDSGIVGQKFNYYAPLVLIVLLALSTILVLIFYALPLLLSRKVESVPKAWGAFFILLGVGFMFVEIPLLQKGSLYLGHPTLSLSVVLFSMLVFAGFGSYWSRRFTTENLIWAVRSCLTVTVIMIAFVSLGSVWLIEQTIEWPLLVKIVLFASLVGGTAFFMGTAFPSGIRLITREHQNAVPWVWALNGGASVMGSVVSMMVAMIYGYMITLVLGGLCYVAALAVLHLASKGKKEQVVFGPISRRAVGASNEIP